MGLRDFLLSKINPRKRSKARSEVETPGRGGPPAPRPTESTPDLRIRTSTSPLTLRDSESNGMRTVISQTISLKLFSLDNPERPSGSNRPPSGKIENTNQGTSDPILKPSAMDENKLHLKTLASSGARLILNGVKESADAFGPLKSVTGGLCFIMDNCEVRHLPASIAHNPYRQTSK